MKYVEDLSIGAVVDCGTAMFERDEIIHFARVFDPQPFHLDDAEAARSLFGALTASGLQVSSAGERGVLAHVMRGVCYLGSPGARHMQMHRPVYVNDVLRFEHSVRKITWLDRWPGVALVEGKTQAFNQDGTLIMTTDDVSWIGSRRLSAETDLSSLVPGSFQAPDLLGPHEFNTDFASEPDVPPPTTRVFLEDCPVGTTFVSQWQDVDTAELDRYRATYDVRLEQTPKFATPNIVNGVLSNHWLNACVNAGLMGPAFWWRTEVAGGGGLGLARRPTPVKAGDRVRARMTVREARPLRSRPLLGVTGIESVCVNQRNEIISTYRAIPFVRMRPPG